MKDICRKFSKNHAKAHKSQQKLETLLSFLSTNENIKQISEIHEKFGIIHRQQVAGVKVCLNDCFNSDNENQLNTFSVWKISDNPKRIT